MSTSTLAINSRRKQTQVPPKDGDCKTLYESLAERAPTFVSFAHVEDARLRRAKELEQHLLFLSELHPECQTAFTSAIKLAHERATQGKKSVRDLILAAMESELAPTTMEEFVDDLGLPYKTLYSALMKLAGQGLVIVTEKRVNHADRPGSGGNRKPTLLFTLAH